jgi:hypothetical protein
MRGREDSGGTRGGTNGVGGRGGYVVSVGVYWRPSTRCKDRRRREVGSSFVR